MTYAQSYAGLYRCFRSEKESHERDEKKFIKPVTLRSGVTEERKDET